jgi:aldehyde dehydrogenase (NAD+)
METYQNYINGEWVDSNSEKTIPNLNPADPADTLGTVRLSTLEDLRWAIGSAEAALIEWKTISVQEKAEFLERARKILGERKEEIIAGITREEGKRPREAEEELNHTIRMLKWIAGEASRLTPTSEKSRYTIRQSLGVVAMMTPFNMPLAAPFWKIAPALLAGCSVVFTPSSLTPLSATWVAKVFEEAGLPPGVLNLVHTSEETASEVFLDHPAVRAISFTGSPEMGKKLAEGAARKGKKVQCEMGGKNPAIVLEDANLERAADHIVQGAFGSAGQRCTATSRVIVEDQVAEKLLDLIEERLSQFESGPVITKERMDTLLEAINVAKKDGAVLRTGGKRLDRDGWFLEPTIFDDVSPRSSLGQEDLFGPILAIQRVGHFEQALIVANEVKYGLSASVHTKNPLKISRFIEEIDAGIAHINAPTTADEPELPFGGRKASGHGIAEMGTSAIDFYTELKAVYLGPNGQ